MCSWLCVWTMLTNMSWYGGHALSISCTEMDLNSKAALASQGVVLVSNLLPTQRNSFLIYNNAYDDQYGRHIEASWATELPTPSGSLPQFP